MRSSLWADTVTSQTVETPQAYQKYEQFTSRYCDVMDLASRQNEPDRQIKSRRPEKEPLGRDILDTMFAVKENKQKASGRWSFSSRKGRVV